MRLLLGIKPSRVRALRSPPRWVGDWLIRSTLASALLIAAVSKAHFRLDAERAARDSTSALALWALIGIELVAGGWLVLIGFRPSWVRAGAFSLFAAFGAVAAYRVGSGNPSCGCLGGMRVDPLWALLFDVASCLALVQAWNTTGRWSVRFTFRQPAFTCLAMLIAAGLVIGAAERPAMLAHGAPMPQPAQPLLLEPNKWIGRIFPLLNQIDIGDDLRRGQWIVLLHRRDCGQCAAVRPEFELLAETRGHRGPQVTFVEIPEAIGTRQSSAASDTNGVIVGSLYSDYEWFVETPVVLVLDNGTVIWALEGAGIGSSVLAAAHAFDEQSVHTKAKEGAE